MPQYVLDARGAGAVDARLEAAGLLDLTMEEAGRAVADAAMAMVPRGRVVVLAGSGANGGDALVAARHLHILGREVAILASEPRHALSRLNAGRLTAVGVEVVTLDAGTLARHLPGAALVVDGLLGTGFRPPLRAELAETFTAVNAWRAAGGRTLAIDIPSGLDAASPDLPDLYLHADATVTLMGYKPAALFGAAAATHGEIHLVPLRVPPEWVSAVARATRPTDAELGALLPVRRADAHKGTAGRVWVLGGHPGTTGAAALAGVGALRAGSGLVTIHSAAEVPLVTPELMVRAYDGWDAAMAELQTAAKPDAVAVGMGLGPHAAEVARAVLAWGVPVMLDADALQPELAGAGHAACIWTPHPGEAARLLGHDTAAVVRDPLEAARALQARLGGVVVLKGGPSVIAHAGGMAVSRGGHPGMASAGMGDTLSGVLAALLGQGLTAPEAAQVGVRLHALAGELAGAEHGYGLIASDVSARLGQSWQRLAGAAR